MIKLSLWSEMINIYTREIKCLYVILHGYSSSKRISINAKDFKMTVDDVISRKRQIMRKILDLYLTCTNMICLRIFKIFSYLHIFSCFRHVRFHFCLHFYYLKNENSVQNGMSTPIQRKRGKKRKRKKSRKWKR